jgi:hypothetical protein
VFFFLLSEFSVENKNNHRKQRDRKPGVSNQTETERSAKKKITDTWNRQKERGL